MMDIYPEDNLTIVCASHNGMKKIPLFLKSIQKNTTRPKDIIICGTHESDISGISKDFLEKNRVSFVISKFANQIYQRNLALSMVSTNYVLQLDDDLILDRNAIKNYCKHFREPNSNKKIVSGYTVFPNGDHMSCRVKISYQKSKFIRIFYSLMNGFKDLKNMSILKSGRIFPLVLEGDETNEPDWLSSCLMFHKDAIKSNPVLVSNKNLNIGKAYYEDVFFTLSLKKRGFKLILDEDITLMHPYTTSIKPWEYIHTISKQKKLLEYTNGSFLLFYLDVFASLAYYSILHIKSKFNKRRS